MCSKCPRLWLRSVSLRLILALAMRSPCKVFTKHYRKYPTSYLVADNYIRLFTYLAHQNGSSSCITEEFSPTGIAATYEVQPTDDWLTTHPIGFNTVPSGVFNHIPSLASCTGGFIAGISETKAIVATFTDTSTNYVGSARGSSTLVDAQNPLPQPTATQSEDAILKPRRQSIADAILQPFRIRNARVWTEDFFHRLPITST